MSPRKKKPVNPKADKSESKSSREDRFGKALAMVHRKYGDDLKKLAD